MVEIGKAQEALKISECGWGWPVMDDLDLGWIHMYAMLINDVAQVIDHVHANLLNMMQLFGPSLAVN